VFLPWATARLLLLGSYSTPPAVACVATCRGAGPRLDDGVVVSGWGERPLVRGRRGAVQVAGECPVMSLAVRRFLPLLLAVGSTRTAVGWWPTGWAQVASPVTRWPAGLGRCGSVGWGWAVGAVAGRWRRAGCVAGHICVVAINVPQFPTAGEARGLVVGSGRDDRLASVARAGVRRGGRLVPREPGCRGREGWCCGLVPWRAEST
jgi:hypothetical protein